MTTAAADEGCRVAPSRGKPARVRKQDRRRWLHGRGGDS